MTALTLGTAIFASTFVLEDGAAVLASIFVLDHRLSLRTAFVALYCGVLASDVALYTLGLAARRVRWFERFVDPRKMPRIKTWIGDRMGFAVVMSRLLPWMLPPTFIACGFFRMPFRRYFAWVAITAGVWTAVMLGLLLEIGAVALEQSGILKWGIIGSTACLLVMWEYAQRVKVHVHGLSQTRILGFAKADRAQEISNASGARGVCTAERLPIWLFYTPVILLWVLLAIRYRSLTLPTAANPSFEAGGLWGESKLQVLSQFSPAARKYVAPYTSLRRSESDATGTGDLATALQLLDAAGLDFPIVAKPDRGQHGHGVRPLFDISDLARYIEDFPPGETIFLQQLVTHPKEAGVFYVRIPGQKSGSIFSLTFSDSPEVCGDGKSTLSQLICAGSFAVKRCNIYLDHNAPRLGWVPSNGEVVPLIFARSHRLGATLVNANRLASPKLVACFDHIANNIQEFYFGRFEIRFKSFELLERGEEFQILEINGAGAEANHIWDPRTSLMDSYRTLFRQFRILFRIGDLNRKRGFQPLGLRQLVLMCIYQQRLVKKFVAADL